MTGRRFQHSRWRLLAAIVLVLSVFASIASLLVHAQQKAQLATSHIRKMEIEADLIGAFLTDSMLRNDYAEARRLLADWPANHKDVALLEVAFDNGRTLFSYRAEDKIVSPLTLSRTFEYRDRSLSLTLCHDDAATAKALASLGQGLFLLAFVLIGVTALTLWFVLFRWMVKPMEQEIDERTSELRAARENLERQVEERTASLRAEVVMRRHAEAASRKLGLAVEQSPICIFITDPDGVIEYVNPMFENFTGFRREEAIGRTPRILRSLDTPKAVHLDLWATIRAGRAWKSELKDCRKDGSEFWANVTIAPIKGPDDSITHFVAVYEDVTDRKQAERTMQEARHAAEMANKAKSEFMANMSHELRTPLNAIIGFSQTMKDRMFGQLGHRRYDEYVDFIHHSGTHLLELINDILDVSAVEAGKLVLHEESLSVRDICEAAVRILVPRAQKGGVALSGIDDAGLPPLRADPRRLKQILLNLLSNAVKFTEPGGVVSCDATVGDDGGLIVTVTDTGIGMDEAGVRMAMSAFGQVDSSLSRKHEGTGLGLPLTKGLVELHGGVFSLESRPGQGTRATVRFPANRVLSAVPAA